MRDASAPMQIVDVRDLGAFLVRSAATATAGPFDGVTPWAPTSSLLAEITPAGVAARLVEADSAILAEAQMTLPMMLADPHDTTIISRRSARPRPVRRADHSLTGGDGRGDTALGRRTRPAATHQGPEPGSRRRRSSAASSPSDPSGRGHGPVGAASVA